MGTARWGISKNRTKVRKYGSTFVQLHVHVLPYVYTFKAHEVFTYSVIQRLHTTNEGTYSIIFMFIYIIYPGIYIPYVLYYYVRKYDIKYFRIN